MWQVIIWDGEYIFNAPVMYKLHCLCICSFPLLFPPFFWPPDYLHESLWKPITWEDFDHNFPAVVEELWEGIQHFILKAFKDEREKDRMEDRKTELRNSEGCIIQHAWK